MSITVLVCDDHPVFLDGLDAMLSAAEEFEVVGQATTGSEAVEKAGDLQPDVIVMDLNMPSVNGIEATRQIRTQRQDAAVLVLTMFEDDDSVFAAMRAGALGYVLKGASREEICSAVEAVSRGEAIFGSGVAQRVIGFFAQGSRSGPRPFPELTDREREVLELAAQGINNAGIARRLSISDKTVRNHISNIFMKLQVADRAGMVAKARDAGIGDTSDRDPGGPSSPVPR